MRRCLVILLVGGCANVLGITPIKEDVDGGDGNAPRDGKITVVVGGTATVQPVTSQPSGIACPGDCDETFPAGTHVRLSTASQTEFTGFFGGPCTGAATCDFAVDGDATIYARFFDPNVNIIFATSTTQPPGGFDSIAAADMLCQTLATNAGLPQGRYLAWLSNSSKSALTRLMDFGPLPGLARGFVRPDGKPVADMVFDLTGGKIHSPPRLDEWGNDVGDDAVVVTETQPDGSTASGSHCQDYASLTAMGALIAGEPAGGTVRWTDRGPEVACNQPVRLYCVGDSTMGAISEPADEPAILFLSVGTVAGNATVSTIDQLCKSEAMAAGLPNSTTMALISPGGAQPVSARFGAGASNLMIASSLIIRPDHVVLGTPDGLLAGDRFAAAPNVTASRTYVDDIYWLGGGSFAKYADDCSGWTSSSGFGATRHAATTRGDTFFDSTPCNQQHRVLCLNFLAIISKPRPTR